MLQTDVSGLAVEVGPPTNNQFFVLLQLAA